MSEDELAYFTGPTCGNQAFYISRFQKNKKRRIFLKSFKNLRSVFGVFLFSTIGSEINITRPPHPRILVLSNTGTGLTLFSCTDA